LEKQLQNPPRKKSNLKGDELVETVKSIHSLLSELDAKQKELADASQQVSFQRMFESLTKLEHLGLDSCPACLTPIDQVSVNPFSHATEELEKFRYLASLQEAEKQLVQQANQFLKHFIEC
jgi:DNA sulfur modification protein DndD